MAQQQLQNRKKSRLGRQIFNLILGEIILNIMQEINSLSQEKQLLNTRVFDFQKMKCSCSNIKKVKTCDEFVPEMMISNFLCRKQGNSLKKSIQIRYLNQVIVIQDRFDFSFPQKIQQTSSVISGDQAQQYVEVKAQEPQQNTVRKAKKIRKSKKTFMPKKQKFRLVQENDNLIEKRRDTKNIPRNLIRVFLHYLEENKLKGHQQIRRMAAQIGFNNTLIEKIIKHSGDIGPLFKQFLELPSEEWIIESKIKDKQSHLQAIYIYRRNYQSNSDIKYQECQ